MNTYLSKNDSVRERMSFSQLEDIVFTVFMLVLNLVIIAAIVGGTIAVFAENELNAVGGAFVVVVMSALLIFMIYMLTRIVASFKTL